MAIIIKVYGIEIVKVREIIFDGRNRHCVNGSN